MKKILIIEDDIVFGRSIGNWLKKQGMECRHVTALAPARKSLASEEFDLVLADLRLPDGNSTELLRWMHGKCLAVPCLIMTNYGQVENAVEAMQLGAVNYLCKPVQPDRLLKAIGKVLSRPKRDGNVFYRGESHNAREMYRQIGLVAASDISVLLRGASGTGKEHIARELHEQSRRRNKPYETVDCGSLPEELAASEFFGHRKGSFTGADSDKAGLFHEADGGTLFLDEVGNLPLEVQQMLLRAIQNKTYRPVGGSKDKTADVRIISATNEDLETAIEEKRFRRDLYYRLREFIIEIPPLRECPEDILPLAEFFLHEMNTALEKSVTGFDEQAKNVLYNHSWTGNVRELRQVVQTAVLLTGEGMIAADALGLDAVETECSSGFALVDDMMQKERIRKALMKAGGNKRQAARLLEISVPTLYKKLEQYNIEQKTD